MTTNPNLKQKVGCWLHERWRAELVLRMPKLASYLGLTWLELCNRHEEITSDPSTGGRICRWQDSSQLTVSRLFPAVGARLLAKCTADWPFEFRFGSLPVLSGCPQVSVIVPIGGDDRLRQFELSLASLRAQQGVLFEIIVVEQSFTPLLSDRLPVDVRYLHARSTSSKMPFNKSWALNVGARHARGRIIVIHDADYAAPRAYVRACCDALDHHEAVRPARFIFHLDDKSTDAMFASRTLPRKAGVSAVVQNNPTPIAVTSETYWQIGGHDESYFGWGGEDAEFLERLRTRAICEAGWAPMVHLWHPPAPQKAPGKRNQSLHAVIAADPPQRRIETLRAMTLGGAAPQATSVSDGSQIGMGYASCQESQ